MIDIKMDDETEKEGRAICTSKEWSVTSWATIRGWCREQCARERTQDEENSGHLVAMLAQQHECILGGSSLIGWILEVTREKVCQL